ncbi:MAG: EAL domain-containing protein [Gammaproteobacteria bacterium]|nr:EAL domain-containing protein [Gammaproteobacteria bacterium]
MKLQFVLIFLLVTGIGLGLTYVTHERYQQRSWELLANDFSRSAHSYTDFIENNFRLRIEELSSIGRFFDASEQVGRNEFKTFVLDLVSREGGFLAVVWTPVIKPHHRHSFEFETSNELGFEYKIKNFHQHSKQSGHGSHNRQDTQRHNKSSQMHGSSSSHTQRQQQPEFFTPVLFVEPFENNKSALGFNLSSEKSRFNSFQKAIQERRVIATERLTLIHQNNDTTGFLLVLPVFDKNDALEGFLVGRMSARKVMHDALTNKNVADLVIKLLETHKDQQRTIVSYGNRDDIHSDKTAPIALEYQRHLEFAGQHWKVQIHPTQSYVNEQLAGNSKFIPILGTLLTILVAVYILTLLNRRSKAENIVAERTAELRGSQFKLNEAQRIARLGSWELDHNSGVMRWSDTLYEILEISPDQFNVSFKNYLSLISSTDDDLVEQVFNAHIHDHDQYHFIHEFKLPDGRKKFLQEHCETRFDGNDNPVSSVGTVQDITEQKESELRIEHMAHHDALTGLPNRTLFKERFLQASTLAHRNRHQLAVVFIDLDGFKIINDSLGHNVGDAVLQEVSKRLKRCTRASDIIGRQSGDEFLVCLTDLTDSLKVSRLCEDILDALRQSFELGEHVVGLSASMGIALYPDNDRDFDGLLRKADTAMYSAKNAGKNTLRFFSDEMNADMLQRLKLLNDMRNGIQQREFLLYYQPQIDFKTGKIVGAEALMRWARPNGEFISPATFIPIAEESGLILKLGHFALEESCRQLADWQQQGFILNMAVNISAIQLSQLDFLKDVSEITKKYGVSSSSLDLELTESLLLKETEKTILMVKAVKQLGVKLSIDDFGTGYSSLSYLKRLNADQLKIDRSFIKDIPYDQDSISITRAIIHMSHDLGLKLVAEGVENKKQYELLQALGCDFCQGYYFSRPVDPDTFYKLLKDNGKRNSKADNLVAFKSS